LNLLLDQPIETILLNISIMDGSVSRNL